MNRSFIVLEGAYKVKTASIAFLILKKTYVLAGSIIVFSIGGAAFFARTKTPQLCVFPVEIMTSPFQSSIILCGWETFTCASCKMEKSVSNVLQ